MSHLPPKPEFGYPPRYPPDPRDYARPPAPSAYPPTPDRYATRERHAFPPRSPPRTRAAPPMDSYVPGRPPVDTYRARPPPPPPMDTYVGAFYERREDDRFRERDWDRRDDHRTRPRDEPPRVRERDRRWEEEPRRSYDKERPERTASKERDWSRRRDDERRYEVEPERKWIPRPSKSPPKRVAPTKEGERSSRSPASRARTPSSPRRRLPSQTPVAASGSASPYKPERSRPIREPSPGEIRLGSHSVSRARRGRSPAEKDRKWVASRRSPTPDRKRRYSPAGRAGATQYRARDRDRDRRSPRRRSYSPAPPPRKRSPAPTLKRSPSPPSRSRSRTRSPTKTPPPKRHVLPKPKSPQRFRTPPLVIARAELAELKTDADGDVEMEDAAAVPSSGRASTAPSVADPAPFSAAPSVTSRVASPSHASVTMSSPAATTPTIPSLPPKPETEPDQKVLRRRWSRSPPTGPRNRAPKSPVAAGTPPQIVQPVPSLPPKPEWTRRNTAAQPAKTESPAPAPAAASEATGSEFIIPKYQPKPNVTADIEAEIARIRSHRTHLESEYVQIAAATRRALHEYELSTHDLKMAEKRRELADAALEKARFGTLGMDYVS